MKRMEFKVFILLCMIYITYNGLLCFDLDAFLSTDPIRKATLLRYATYSQIAFVLVAMVALGYAVHCLRILHRRKLTKGRVCRIRQVTITDTKSIQRGA